MNDGPVPVTALWPVATSTYFVTSGGRPSIGVVVKASFSLERDRDATLIAPVPLTPADVRRASGALTAASELAPPRPNAAVVLTGHAYAPPGKAVQSMSVWLRVLGSRPLVDKMLHVFGDRSGDAGPPRPFRQIPLEYERAAWSERNPVGVRSDAGRLPNLVHARDPRAPAGFGPIPAEWSRGAVPAPEDQQCPFLSGDEWIVLDGVHPTLPRIASRLPGLRAEAQAIAGDGRTMPLPLNAELLVIDADRAVASVVFRGSMPREHATVPGIRVLVVLAPTRAAANESADPRRSPAESDASPDETLMPFAEALARPALPFSAAMGSADAAPRPPDAAVPDVFAPAASDEPDPDATLVPSIQELARAMARPVAPFAVALPGESTGAGRGAIPGAPWASGPMEAPSADDARQMKIAPLAPPLEETPEPGKPSERASGAPGPESSRAIESPAPATSPTSGDVGAPPASVDAVSPTRTDNVREILAARIREGRSLSDLALTGADLNGMDLTNASLASADLSGAKLVGAKLERAALSRAKLVGADLTDAVLAHADLGSADLRKAKLERARFDDADLSDARLDEAEGAGALFERARLARVRASSAKLAHASFRGVDAVGSSWERSALDGAVFEDARLKEASLARASAADAKFARADLTGARLDRLACRGADFTQASLVGAELEHADAARASFEKADLRDAVASRAELVEARLEGADLRGATLRQAKLAKADLRDARLDGADLQGADLSAADVRGATLGGAKLARADTRGWITDAPGSTST